MSKYEIMLIIDPKAEIDKTKKLLKEVFSDELTSFEKMERTELAYPIKHSMQAQYALAYVSTSNTALIKEFRRRSSLSKDIWRIMIINVNSEVGLGKISKKKLVWQHERSEKRHEGRQEHHERSEKRYVGKQEHQERTENKQEEKQEHNEKLEKKLEHHSKTDIEKTKLELTEKKIKSPRKYVNKDENE